MMHHSRLDLPLTRSALNCGAEKSPRTDRRELKLLSYFASHGEVLSRDRLLNEFGATGIMERRELDQVIISCARNSSDAADHPKHLLTVHGGLQAGVVMRIKTNVRNFVEALPAPHPRNAVRYRSSSPHGGGVDGLGNFLAKQFSVAFAQAGHGAHGTFIHAQALSDFG
jgi:hypothetical protein